LDDVKKSLETAATRLGKTQTRTRVMLRNLKGVEALPTSESSKLLPEDGEAFDATSDQLPEDRSS